MDTSKYEKLLYVKETINFNTLISGIKLAITDKLDVTISFDGTNYQSEAGLIHDNKTHILIGFTEYTKFTFWGDGESKISYIKNDILKITNDNISQGVWKLNGKEYKQKILNVDNKTEVVTNISGYQNIKGISFYDYQIKDSSDNLKYHFIPALRLSDNKAGLYDDVNDVFYKMNNAKYEKLPFDFSKVKNIQIPEGNVVRIDLPSSSSSEEAKTVWFDKTKAYGIRWNSNVPEAQATTACKRIGNLELHKTLPIQSKFKVCVHKEGSIQYYCAFNDSRFRRLTRKPSNYTCDYDTYVLDILQLLSGGGIAYTSSKQEEGLDEKLTSLGLGTTTDSRTPSGRIDGVIAANTSKYSNELDYLFNTYKYLYMWLKFNFTVNTSDGEGAVDSKFIARVEYVDTTERKVYIALNDISQIDNFNTVMSEETLLEATNVTIEFGACLNGYDGEVGVYTPKFYLWSIDNDGENNEVWMSEYKCVNYAREVKAHIIGLNRCPILNTAFNDEKWGYINTLKANTAVDVINYHPYLRGGSYKNADMASYDKYLGQDNFRGSLCKGTSNIPLATMRTASQANGGQVLYYQIWSAIVWCYIIEYANFDAQLAYNSTLTSEGYHQGGLGNNIININNWKQYNLNIPVCTNDFTLELGNNTGIVNKSNTSFSYNTPNPNTWSMYNLQSDNTYTRQTASTIIYTKISNLIQSNTSCIQVSGTQKYKIEGITGTDQTVIFRGREGKEDLTITSDGTYTIDWGHNSSNRTILFGVLQDTCNITFTIVESNSSYANLPQIALNVAHYRGFNVFWFGDSWLNIDNFLSEHNGTNRIFYITEDINKFSNDIGNKEIQIKGLGTENENFLKEVVVNKTGDIIPSKLGSSKYKYSYCWNYTNTSICTTFAGDCAGDRFHCGLLSLRCYLGVNAVYPDDAFAKCFILEN